jgi:hypothetical protein
MTYHLTRLAPLLAASMALSLSAHANPNTWAVAPALSQSSDSDGLNVRKAFATGLFNYTNGLKWQGVEWQEQRYTQNGMAISGHGLNYTEQDINPITGMGHSLKLGINQGPQKTTAIGDWNYNQALNAQLNWGVFASRDWVESIGALQQGIHYDLVGSNLDYQIQPRFTLVGSLAQTRFSNGHDRQQQRALAVWDMWPDLGVTLQLAFKHQMGEKDVLRPLYFNPNRLDESMSIITWRRRNEGWQWYARLGEGRQKVNDQFSTPARVTDLQLTSPVQGHSYFKLRVGRTETSGLSGPGYVNRYADVQWIWRIGH